MTMNLQNHITTIPLGPDKPGETAAFADLIRIVIDALSAKDGCTIAQMRTRLAIVGICEAGGDMLLFNSEQTQALKAAIANHKWYAHHKDLVLLAESIEAADSPST